MRIGILGAGTMADALGFQWGRAAHEVMVSGRNAEKARTTAGRIRARAGTFAEAAEFGEVVLTALPPAAVSAVLQQAGAEHGALRGRVVIDCTDPFDPERFTLSTAGGPSMPELIAAQAIGARVVKAFNLCAAGVYRMTPPVFDGTPLGIPMCGHPEAVDTAAALATDIGCTPIAAGGMDRAALLEAAGVLIAGLWFSGADPATIIPPLKHAFG